MRRGWLGRLLGAGLALAALMSGSQASAADGPRLYYHVFVRSFADSNGDRIGDLPGVAAHLDYLAKLHVTHILLTPMQASPFYHNYFATDFDAVDEAYGGEAGWLAFVRAAHARHMKVILDEEFQYVAEGHPWWRANEGRPGRPEGRFVLWNDPAAQKRPEPFLNAPKYRTHDGRMVGIAMVDLHRNEVREWFERMLLRRVDPHGDGSLTDGVDGFRIDHMMDDLDGKGRMTDLFSRFWKPLITSLRAVRPDLEFIAEPSDWGDGRDHMRRGGATAVFDFPLRAAIVRLDAGALRRAVSAARLDPPGTHRLSFIENHDVDRFASLMNSDPAKLRIGATLGLMLGSDPILYYGQELGMRGVEEKDHSSDGAQIPLREAFRWQADLEAPGSAIWYTSDASWWTGRVNRTGDGVSVEEEAASATSLLAFYRSLLDLRARRPELWRGHVVMGCEHQRSAVCFSRRLGRRWTFVVANLSDKPVTVSTQMNERRAATDLLEGGKVSTRTIIVPPWGLRLVGDKAR